MSEHISNIAQWRKKWLSQLELMMIEQTHLVDDAGLAAFPEILADDVCPLVDKIRNAYKKEDVK